jgi:hypothetical protein
MNNGIPVSPDPLSSQRKREAIFNGGAGQAPPINHAFIDNKRFVKLTPSMHVESLINMGQGTEKDSVGHTYGKQSFNSQS